MLPRDRARHRARRRCGRGRSRRHGHRPGRDRAAASTPRWPSWRSTGCAPTARARPRRASTGRPWRGAARCSSGGSWPSSDSAPLVVLDASPPASEEALDMAVRAAASLCVHLARARRAARSCCPGERRSIEVGRDLAAWPADPRAPRPGRGRLRRRRPPRSRRAAAPCIWVTGADLTSAPRALERMPAGARDRRAPARRCAACGRCSRSRAAPAAWSSARAGGWPRERRAATGAGGVGARTPTRSGRPAGRARRPRTACARSCCGWPPSRRWRCSGRRTGPRLVESPPVGRILLVVGVTTATARRARGARSRAVRDRLTGALGGRERLAAARDRLRAAGRWSARPRARRRRAARCACSRPRTGASWSTASTAASPASRAPTGPTRGPERGCG